MKTIDDISLDRDIERLFVATEEDFINRDHRQCDCPLTYVHRKRHAALGTGIEIRLCCLAKKVEEIAGLPPGTFFFAMDFEPTWDWDCEQIMESYKRKPDGSVETIRRKLGPPPRWLRERLKQKGLPIHNEPELG